MPIFEKLQEYHSKNRISFAMPGHKNGRKIDKRLLDCDVTELSMTVDLHGKSSDVEKSFEALSEKYGSEKSYIVTGGSTACIQAMLAGVLNPGDTLLAAADCHMSVINTCALCGFNMRFIPKTIDGEFLIPKQLFPIEEILKKHTDIKAVLITSPTYYGIAYDIEKLSDICHSYGVMLLVDEAHGAHFIADERFPKCAIASGADAVCQSAHKTLNALTGAAFLHLSGKYINYSRCESALRMFESSSPSYVIASSAELALSNLSGWDTAINMCNDFRYKISQNSRIKVLDNDDKTRLVLNFSAYSINGTEIDSILSKKYGIDIEMSDRDNIVLIVTPANTDKDLEKLYLALLQITENLPESNTHYTISQPPVSSELLMPYKAFYGDVCEEDIKKCEGCICAENVCAYPPGIPVMAMGARITAEQLEYVEYLLGINACIKGINEGKIKIVRQEN